MQDEVAKARRELVNLTKRNLIGPGSAEHFCDDNEIITTRPTTKYTAGILYPQKAERDLQEEIDDTGGSEVESKEDQNSFLDNHINMTNQYYPSAMGISFYVEGEEPELALTIYSARYVDTKPDDCKVKIKEIPYYFLENEKFNEIFECNNGYLRFKKGYFKKDKEVRKDRDYFINEIKKQFSEDHYFNDCIYNIYDQLLRGYKRLPIKKNINSSLGGEMEVADGLKIKCVKKPERFKTLITISLINSNFTKGDNVRKDKQAFYQCGFKVECPGAKILEYNKDKLSALDEEEKSLALLYSDKKTFGAGHGCSVQWKKENKNTILSTSIIPEYEVPKIKYVHEKLEKKDLNILSILKLSDLSDLNLDKKISQLHEFCDSYEEWIEELEKENKYIENELKEIGHKHIEMCKETLNRMREGINLIYENKNVRKAFALANRAMLMQMVHSDLQSDKKYPENKAIEWPDYQSKTEFRWRPFQLAFILISLKGINENKGKERDLADLIWFPTGGGKTEAYLGIIAYTIFLRRLKDPERGKGTAVFMRYTLRLLTTQQFQRASTLICACEKIRRKNEGKLGDEKFSIGLWIGSKSTPNKTEEALNQLTSLTEGTRNKNKFQILKCPWCGTIMEKTKDGKGEWGYRSGHNPKKLILYCPRESCDFNLDHELPIKVVDEDIYKKPPTLLFGTVDKFAQMPWRKEVSRLFALDEDNENLSPELIIQDELHLISGPLGTIVGLYETAIDALCSAKGIKPKIIASTATIRRAKDQCRALYDRNMKQFPPPGLSDEDSFFAKEIPLEKEPGRLYAGIMSSGNTQVTTEINLISSLLQLTSRLDYEKKILDKFWTLTGYFNSLRELGRCSTMIHNNIKEEVRRIAESSDLTPRKLTNIEELTSRNKSKEIPEVLERLQVEYPDKSAIDILLASNMISVGMDIDRLGLMVVVGQPKTTSEYIQATSRVGRKFPGIVFTLYDGARSRDRSHYESFLSYHQSFYKYVEPTSVTPFSGPARERALHAVIVSLIRHLTGLKNNNEISEFNLNMDIIPEIKNIILDRVKNISQDEVDDTKEEIDNKIRSLADFAEENSDLHYAWRKQHLLFPYSKENGSYWRTLQSMRNVDQPTKIKVID